MGAQSTRSRLVRRSTRAFSMAWARSRSCPARRSTGACARSSVAWPADRESTGACARSSVAWPADRESSGDDRTLSETVLGSVSRRSVGRAVAVQSPEESVELIAREAPLAARGAIAAEVPGARPAPDRGQRDSEVYGRLGAREHKSPIGSGIDGVD